MNTHTRDLIAEPRWRGRLRLALLACAVVLGFVVATMERFRPESLNPFWTQADRSLGRYTRAVGHATLGLIDRATHLDDLIQIDKELDVARRELTEARLQQQLLQEQVARMQRLVGGVRWDAPNALQFLTADIIAIHTQEGSAETTINRGAQDHVALRDPVVALGGLVGVVRSVGPDHALVQTLSDPGSVVGAVTREGRTRGVVRGRGRDKPLEFVTEDEIQAIEPGAELITSGFDNSIYPKGILIGKITGVDLNVYGIPYGIVEPAVAFNRVEEVLLILPTLRLSGQAGDGPTSPSLGRITLTMPGAQAQPTTPATTGTQPLTAAAVLAMIKAQPTLMHPPIDTSTSATLAAAAQPAAATPRPPLLANPADANAASTQTAVSQPPSATPSPTPTPKATPRPASDSRTSRDRETRPTTPTGRGEDEGEGRRNPNRRERDRDSTTRESSADSDDEQPIPQARNSDSAQEDAE